MVQQVVHLSHKGKTSIHVIADDTDVFILLIHFYSQQQLTCSAAISVGSGRKCVDIQKTTREKIHVLKSLETSCLIMCFLAVTQHQDCGDVTPVLLGKGK